MWDDQCDLPTEPWSHDLTYFSEVILKKKCSKIAITPYQNWEIRFIEVVDAIIRRAIIMEWFKALENVLNRMLMLTAIILRKLLFKQDAHKYEDTISIIIFP